MPLLLAGLAACRRSGSDAQPAPTPAPEAPAPAASDVPPSGPRKPLRPLESFASIQDPAERSRALFLEASRVMLHPRCSNCHPAGDVPHQGMEWKLHDPPVVRGPDDRGVVGMECTGCHQDHNLPLARVPGAPNWHLAPREMAWVGRTPHSLCEQLKDPQRNGGRTLAQLVEHNAHDKLVGWGWEPGHGREPAPGTQEAFGKLVQAWVDTGAQCPPEEAKP
nr:MULTISPECIES: Isoquinoline 1-oxidoreductase subunit [Myxococcaceae]